MPKTPDLPDTGHHHQPRKADKRKKHHRGFSEDVQDKRQSRIGFKKYLQELDEEFQTDDLDGDEE
jgi:hypothetical protein